VDASIGITVCFSLGPAILTTHRGREAPFLVKRLLACCEYELLAAIAAGERLITHYD